MASRNKKRKKKGLSAEQFNAVIHDALTENELKDMRSATEELIRVLRRLDGYNKREIKRMESWLDGNSDVKERIILQKDIKKLNDAFPKQFYVQLTRWHKKIRVS